MTPADNFARAIALLEETKRALLEAKFIRLSCEARRITLGRDTTAAPALLSSTLRPSLPR